MEFDTEFIQFTSLEPPIYRLKETLNLLKNELWLSSVRMEVSHVRTIFCDIVILSLSGPCLDDLTERPDNLCYNSFPRSNGTQEYSKMLDSVRTCCHVVRTTCRNFPNSDDF
jgi:hypothetical protein